LLCLFVYFAYSYIDEQMKLSTLHHYLTQVPGVAVTSADWEDDRIVVEGLQDPDAVIPYDTLAANRIPEDELLFKTIPFRSLEVDMELQRFKNEMDLPPGVYLGVREGRIFLYGEAPVVWLIDNDVRLRQLSADRRLNSGIRMSSVVGDELTSVEIGGLMNANKLALLQAIFAANNWVTVTATLAPESRKDGDGG